LFGQTSDHGGALLAAAGQYLGFAAIRAAAAASALGAAQLREDVIAYLGLTPSAFGELVTCRRWISASDPGSCVVTWSTRSQVAHSGGPPFVGRGGREDR
jgi:cadmium resistance protein CadD (predicted permease)